MSSPPRLSRTASAWRWLTPLALMGAIWICSSGRPETPPGLDFRLSDKLIHVLVFGLLATTACRVPALVARPRVAPFWAIFVVGLYALVDELHQGLTPGRSMDALDWAADLFGAVLAAFLYRDAPWYRRALEFPRHGGPRPPAAMPSKH